MVAGFVGPVSTVQILLPLCVLQIPVMGLSAWSHTGESQVFLYILESTLSCFTLVLEIEMTPYWEITKPQIVKPPLILGISCFVPSHTLFQIQFCPLSATFQIYKEIPWKKKSKTVPINSRNLWLPGTPKWKHHRVWSLLPFDDVSAMCVSPQLIVLKGFTSYANAPTRLKFQIDWFNTSTQFVLSKNGDFLAFTNLSRVLLHEMTIIGLVLLYILVSMFLLILPCCFHHSPPVWSSPGYLSASAAGVFPGFRELRAIRPVSGCWDLPHGADSLVDSGAHVGRQLPHCSTPPRGGSHFRLQQDPRPAQHKRH